MLWVRFLLRLRASRLVPSRLVYELWFLYGADIPAGVRIGSDVLFEHRAMGVVIHPCTVIGDRAHIWHNVTLGRSDAYVPADESPFRGFEIGEGAYICSGATILGGPGITRVGNGTVVGANAVLRQSTGDWEIWAGIPAKKVADRPRPDLTSAS